MSHTLLQLLQLIRGQMRVLGEVLKRSLGLVLRRHVAEARRTMRVSIVLLEVLLHLNRLEVALIGAHELRRDILPGSLLEVLDLLWDHRTGVANVLTGERLTDGLLIGCSRVQRSEGEVAQRFASGCRGDRA